MTGIFLLKKLAGKMFLRIASESEKVFERILDDFLGVLRVEFLLKTESGYLRDAEVT